MALQHRSRPWLGLLLGGGIGLMGLVVSTLALLAGPAGAASLHLVAFAPWGDRDEDRAALWAAGFTIASEWAGSTFVVGGSVDSAALEALPAMVLPLGAARAGCVGMSKGTR